jgi:hypothetical protein
LVGEGCIKVIFAFDNADMVCYYGVCSDIYWYAKKGWKALVQKIFSILTKSGNFKGRTHSPDEKILPTTKCCFKGDALRFGVYHATSKI